MEIIRLNTPSNAKLAIRTSKGYYTNYLNLETDQSSINLNSTSEIGAPLLITVPDKVDSVSVEGLTLYGHSANVRKSNDQSIPLVVRNLTIDSSNSMKISNMTIQGPLNMKQTSSLTFTDSVSLSEADIKYKIDLLNGIEHSVFSGNASSIPNSFSIELPEDTFNLSQIQNIILYDDGNFDCDEWRKKVSSSSKYFDDAKCEPIIKTEDSKLLAPSSSERLVLPKKAGYINTDNGPNVIEKNKGLSGGAIAGIVIGCIVAVAALMVGEYFLIMHFKNKESPSENEAEEV